MLCFSRLFALTDHFFCFDWLFSDLAHQSLALIHTISFFQLFERLVIYVMAISVEAGLRNAATRAHVVELRLIAPRRGHKALLKGCLSFFIADLYFQHVAWFLYANQSRLITGCVKFRLLETAFDEISSISGNVAIGFFRSGMVDNLPFLLPLVKTLARLPRILFLPFEKKAS